MDHIINGSSGSSNSNSDTATTTRSEQRVSDVHGSPDSQQVRSKSPISFLALPDIPGGNSVREHLRVAGHTVQHAGEEVISHTRSLWQEFIEFIDQGNVIELAIGVIIAGVFTKVVDSLVNDVLLPHLGSNLANNFVIIRKPDPSPSPGVVTQSNNLHNTNNNANKEHYQLLFALIQLLNSTNGTITVEEFNTPEQAQEAGAVTLNYGRFLQTLLNFFLISFCLYVIIRIFQLFQREAIFNKLIRCKYCRKEISKKAIRCPIVGLHDSDHYRCTDGDNENNDNSQIDIQRLALMEPVGTSTTRTLRPQQQQQQPVQRRSNNSHIGGRSPTSTTPLLSMHHHDHQ
ncbi:hypothetical protein BDF22DRAFT_685485 [Syncephalis plumigaleata]|nr:hypothetical protein BDF22DRAFT_685485 [Syncephalis plumigaleata]